MLIKRKHFVCWSSANNKLLLIIMKVWFRFQKRHEQTINLGNECFNCYMTVILNYKNII